MLNQISESLQKGKAKIVKQLAIDAGISAQDILENGLIASMNVVGKKFRNKEIFVPEVLVAARALNMGSALLTTTMPVMEEVVKAAEAAGIRDHVKIMIGGAPVTEEFRAQIGADVYTDDAAVKLCGC